MSKRNLGQFWSKYQVWFYRAVLIVIILFLLAVGTRLTNFQNQDATSFNNFYNLAERKPQDSDFYIGPDEDQQLLDETLKKIFPQGTYLLSDEQKAIEIERFMVTYFKNERTKSSGNATDFIKEGKSICGGKSYVFRILLRKLNIPARYIGLFYAPSQGGHVLAEVYYQDSWHLFDPTFGIFVYSESTYNHKGYILSMDELRKDPKSQVGYIQQVTDKPWSGEYSEELKQFGVKPLDKDYFIKQYGQNFNDYWRNEVEKSFPVAYGENSWISVPVDVDLTNKNSQSIGARDGDSTDVAIHEARFEGTNYLGKTVNIPLVYNTWTVNIDAPKDITIKYWTIGKNYAPKIIPLRSIVIKGVDRNRESISINLSIIDDPGVFLVMVPEKEIVVDAIEVFKE